MSGSKPHLWVRIVVPDIGAIGPGKIDLLVAIDDEHSISAAARKLGMSYRRAWLLLDDTRRVAGTDVVETFAGGAERGGATLTEAGRRLIAAYNRIVETANKAVADELEGLVVRPEKPPKSVPAKAKRRPRAS